LTQCDPFPACWFEFRRHLMANCSRIVRDSAVVTVGTCRKPTSLFRMVWSMTTSLPFPKMGSHSQMRHLWCWISNGYISATGHQIHIMFCSCVGFWGLAGRMALFLFRSNPWHDMTEDNEPSNVSFCQITLPLLICLRPVFSTTTNLNDTV